MIFRLYGRQVAVVAAVCALGGFGVLPGTGMAAARAETKADMGAMFGSVDVQKVADQTKLLQQTDDDTRAYAEGLNKSLQRLANGSARLLSDAEIRELSALYEKGGAADADQKRITALETKADTTGAEFSRLQQNAAPNDAEKKRFSDLSEAQKKGDAVLRDIQNDYEGRVQTKHNQLLQKLTAQIRETVSKVAKEKGLAVVFDSQAAVYTQNDITAEVIKRLTPTPGK